MFETDQIVEFRIVLQSKRKIFLSTCRSDKHYIKFGCSIPRSNTQEFLSKKFCQVPKPNVARKNKWNGRGTGSTIGVLKSRFPAFFSSESRHPALFYARIPIPRHFVYEIFCLIIEVDVI